MHQLLMRLIGRQLETGRDSALLSQWTLGLHTVCINNAGPGGATEHMINKLPDAVRPVTYITYRKAVSQSFAEPSCCVLQRRRDGTSTQQVTSAP